jgi:hypothetical protein
VSEQSLGVGTVISGTVTTYLVRVEKEIDIQMFLDKLPKGSF